MAEPLDREKQKTINLIFCSSTEIFGNDQVVHVQLGHLAEPLDREKQKTINYIFCSSTEIFGNDQIVHVQLGHLAEPLDREKQKIINLIFCSSMEIFGSDQVVPAGRHDKLSSPEECTPRANAIMSSLSISRPSEISLVELTKRSQLIAIAHRLDDDQRPGFSARYRIDTILRDAYHTRHAELQVAKPGDEIQPLPPDVNAQAAASRHLADLFKRGISAAVCVEPSFTYRSSLAEGTRDCLLFLQPIVHAEKVAFMYAAYNSVESLSSQASVQRVLSAAGMQGLDSEVVMALRPPSYRVVHSYFEHLEDRDAAKAILLCHPELHFSDPIYGDLHGREALGRWPLFFANTSEPSLTFLISSVNAEIVQVRYSLHYIDVATGRKIDNSVLAEISVSDNRIVRHSDSFDTWRLAAMQLGLRGRLFGFLRSTTDVLRQKARQELAAYLRRSAV